MSLEPDTPTTSADQRQIRGEHFAAGSRWVSPRIIASSLGVLVPAIIIVAEGWSRRWVTDDAYIDFRVVANLTSGHGPVFNRGERVEVYTDPLWVAVLAIVHYLSFISIAWWAVLLGLAFTATGVAFGGRGGQLLGAQSDPRPILILPLGMLVFVSIDASWDFATSGMETGLIFFWEGLSWWLLARRTSKRIPLSVIAVVIGIGPLIRPDLGLISVCLLLGVLAIETAGMSWKVSMRRTLFTFAVAYAIPILYEVWRMAYYALLVPNTALAKSAASSWWSQGDRYLNNFVGPYWLWIPLALALSVVTNRLVLLHRRGDARLGMLVSSSVVGGLLNALYVIRVGGDFMHGRMLLPGLFAICLAFYVPIRSVSSLVIGTSTAAWAVCAIGLLHYPQTIAFTHGIANERAFYVAVSGTPHPVTSTNYLHSPLGRIGTALKNVAVDRAGAKDAEVLLSDSGSPDPSLYAPIQMPESVVAPLINIGVEADIAGPHVYIFDELSLANPIGSHLKEDVRTRPGHSQVILGDWMVARFVPQGNGPVADQLVIQDARAALNCGVIRRYLQAITSPLSFGRAVSNFVHAFQYSAFTMSPDPSTARRQMCDG